MCPPDSTPDPKHSTRHTTALVVRPTAVLDPYSERATTLAGVRQHTAPTATQTRKSATPFVGSGRRRLFGASLLIALATQGVLAAVIATSTLNPAFGATAAVGLMICGLGLMLAEAAQVAGR